MPWSRQYTGTTETSTGEDEVTFKEKTDAQGMTTDILISRGDRLTDDHAHVWYQNKDTLDHHNDSTGVLNDNDEGSKSKSQSKA